MIYIILVGLVLIAVTLHELAHGYAAYFLGDDTAQEAGRLTLNPLKHIDFFWTIVIPLLMYMTVGFCIGAAKPVPITPYKLRNPKYGMIVVALAGPLMNIFLAWIIAMLLQTLSFLQAHMAGVFLGYFILLNLFLAVFNLVPIPPLDGSRVVQMLLPRKQAIAYGRLAPYGFIIIILLFYFNMLNTLIMPVKGLWLLFGLDVRWFNMLM